MLTVQCIQLWELLQKYPIEKETGSVNAHINDKLSFPIQKLLHQYQLRILKYMEQW